jgi:hypothetical protein
MAKRWMSVLPDKLEAWQIPNAMTLRLRELISEAEILQDRANSPEGTKGDAARTAFHELVAHMRDIRRRVFFMPPLTEGSFADLGLQPPDMVRTPHIDVPEMVDFVIHLSTIRELLVDSRCLISKCYRKLWMQHHLEPTLVLLFSFWVGMKKLSKGGND